MGATPDLVSVSRQELSSMISMAVSQALHGHHHSSPPSPLANYPHAYLASQPQPPLSLVQQHQQQQPLSPSPYGQQQGFYSPFAPSPSWPYALQVSALTSTCFTLSLHSKRTIVYLGGEKTAGIANGTTIFAYS